MNRATDLIKVGIAAMAIGVIPMGSLAYVIDVKPLYSDRYTIDKVEVRNLRNQELVILQSGETLALGDQESRVSDKRISFLAKDDLQITAYSTDGEVTVITERPDDDHTVWVNFINTLDSAGERHTVYKIGGLYYIQDIEDVSTLADKRWERPTTSDLKATADYFSRTKVCGLYDKEKLSERETIERGLQAFMATPREGMSRASTEGTSEPNKLYNGLDGGAVQRDREANHKAMVSTMLGYDPDQATTITARPFGQSTTHINFTDKTIVFPGMNFDNNAMKWSLTLPNNTSDWPSSISANNHTTDDWGLVMPRRYSVSIGDDMLMVLYGKADGMQLKIYDNNPDKEFYYVEKASYTLPNYLDYSKYSKSDWTLYEDTKARTDVQESIKADMQNSAYKYMRMQSAEAETSICSSGNYIFVFQGNHVIKIDTESGTITDRELEKVTASSSRTCWTSVVYDFNGDGYDDILAIADDNHTFKQYSVAIYGTSTGFSETCIEKLISSYEERVYNRDYGARVTSLDAKIVYPEGKNGAPMLQVAMVPVSANYLMVVGYSVLENTGVIFHLDLSGENKNIWDEATSESDVQSIFANDNNFYVLAAHDGYFWKTKIEPVYPGGMETGSAPIISANWNRVYSPDYSKCQPIYTESDSRKIVDIHFDQFTSISGDYKTLPNPECYVITTASSAQKVYLTDYTYEGGLSSLPISRSFNKVYDAPFNTGSNNNTGFASIPMRYKDGTIIEYESSEVYATNPNIYTILAAPPFNDQTAKDGGAEASSYYTITSSTGVETEESTSESLKAGFSASISFLDVFKIGYDLTVSKEWIQSFSSSLSKTNLTNYNVTGKDDGVNFSFIPVDKFIYKVVKSDNPNIVEGEKVYFYNQREEEPRYTTWKLNTFNERLYGTGLPVIDNSVLPHEPGNLGSYRHIKQGFTEAELCALFNIDKTQLVGYTEKNINPGDAGPTGVEISIEKGNGSAKGESVTTEVEISIGCEMEGLGGMDLKTGSSSTVSWTRTDTWGKSLTMGGQVPPVTNVDYQYLCRQVFYRLNLKDENGNEVQDCLVNDWVVISNTGETMTLQPKLTIKSIKNVINGTYAVDVEMYGKKATTSTTSSAAKETTNGNKGLDHFMLESTVDGDVWHDANTTLTESGSLIEEDFDLSNGGAYDQYEATIDFQHDYLYLTNEQLQQLIDYSLGRTTTPVIATYRLTLSDVVGNTSYVEASVQVPSIESTAVDEILAERNILQAENVDGKIVVKGAMPNSEVRVVDMMGRVIAVAKSDSTGYVRIGVSPSGIAIITNSGRSVKLSH